jgi:hypothetical protein
MNARVLIADASGELYARLAAATLVAEEVNDQWFGRAVPEDTGLGFMEFFDWLAGTSDRELNTLYRGLDGQECLDLANPHARERVALYVWSNM